MQNYEHDSEIVDIEGDIRNFLDIDQQQAAAYAGNISQMNALQQHFASYPEDEKIVENSSNKRNQLARECAYKEPFRVVLVGPTGVGKSELFRGILGRNLSRSDMWGAVTSAVMEVYMDHSQENETATVSWHNESAIGKIIEEQLFGQFIPKAHQFKTTPIDDNLLDKLRKCQTNTRSQEETDRFENVRSQLLTLASQHINIKSKGESLKEEFPLNDRDIPEELNEILKEGSGKHLLVSKVRFDIATPNEDSHSNDVSLPHNVVLVDLPGSGGDFSHTWILMDELKKVDACLLVFEPGRFATGESTQALLNQQIAPWIGNVPRDRLFPVLNQIDKVQEKDRSRMHEEMLGMVKGLYRGSPDKIPQYQDGHPYFLIAARAGRMAKDNLRSTFGKNEQDTYQADMASLGIDVDGNLEDLPHDQVLVNSRLPNLVEALRDYVKTGCVENRITAAHTLVDNIVDDLLNGYGDTISSLEAELGGQKVSDSIIERRLIDNEGIGEDALILNLRREVIKVEPLKKELLEAGAEISKKCLSKDNLQKMLEEYAHLDINPVTGDGIRMFSIFKIQGGTNYQAALGLSTMLPTLSEICENHFRLALDRSKIEEVLTKHSFGKFSYSVLINESIKEMTDDLNSFARFIASRTFTSDADKEFPHFDNRVVDEQADSSPGEIYSLFSQIQKTFQNYFSASCKHDLSSDVDLSDVDLKDSHAGKLQTAVSEWLHESHITFCIEDILNFYLFRTYQIQDNLGRKWRDKFTELRTDLNAIRPAVLRGTQLGEQETKLNEVKGKKAEVEKIQKLRK